MSGELSPKMDVLDLIINVMRDHEKVLDKIVTDLSYQMGELKKTERSMDIILNEFLVQLRRIAKGEAEAEVELEGTAELELGEALRRIRQIEDALRIKVRHRSVEWWQKELENWGADEQQ